MDELALALPGHQAALGEAGQVHRRVGLTQARPRHDLPGAQRPVAQRLEDPEPGDVAEPAEELLAKLDTQSGHISEGRAFPLIPELRAILEGRQALTRRCERGQGRIIAHVFHRYGKPIKSLRRAWTTACKNAGRPGLLLHDLRRSAVRNLERAGISRSVAMKLTGHKTEAVYRRYAIVAEGDLREAGTKLAAALGMAAATASLSDNSGDNSVTARKGRSLSS